ncbi:hypothetical protein VHEMI02826 [[Torrubiella] hemipterigena]|uniref:CRAL-TRIO domain-containing protein n=1 Tax=[Torrubiella] hemipterigena TaxID=1531966 RepID=A0A0A1SQT2_9HYPO|nr:hypothetical protein VHEMI02826 [[Torrubiella] hemipterigena]
MDHKQVFEEFKSRCEAAGYLEPIHGEPGDDLASGINDDGTLLRFLRAREYNVENAFVQFSKTQKWRDANQLIKLYETIDVNSFEDTRKMYTHWTGRRDRKGTPICLFEIGHLTPSVMQAYSKSCLANSVRTTQTESEAMLRLFCTYESLVRFIMPLCSAIPNRVKPDLPVTSTTCIVDISGVGIMQFWRLNSHLQAASALATANYPETLGKTFVIGAPSFFSTIWGWLNGWFDKNTVSKICIVPPGQELTLLSEIIDPNNIPTKYGGTHDFSFGMFPDLDDEIKGNMTWLDDDLAKDKRLPVGSMRWIEKDGQRRVLAVGTENGVARHKEVIALTKANN